MQYAVRSKQAVATLWVRLDDTSLIDHHNARLAFDSLNKLSGKENGSVIDAHILTKLRVLLGDKTGDTHLRVACEINQVSQKSLHITTADLIPALAM